MSKTKIRIFDVIWGIVIVLWAIMLLVPASRNQYLVISGAHKYMMGFFNFFILATMGDLLAGRISNGKWTMNITTFFKALVWGFIGMAITLFFGLNYAGVAAVQKTHLLPFEKSNFAHAFFTALLTNLTFGPAMFIFHKFTDAFIDRKYNKKSTNVTALIESIDWKTFFKFNIFTTLPLFWIPCHTIDFLLPPEYRVLLAAFLGIALGLLLTISKKAKAAK